MKMRITEMSRTRATISYDEECTGERVTLECVAADSRGWAYVSVLDSRRGSYQICDRLGGANDDDHGECRNPHGCDSGPGLLVACEADWDCNGRRILAVCPDCAEAWASED